MATSKLAVFKAPAEYAIYGGPPGGPILRVSGATTLTEAEDIVFGDRKKRPDWTYSIWRSLGWEKVE
jgi:hypothetical protein